MSEIREMTATVDGVGLVDVLVEYDTEYSPADPSVGIFCNSIDIHILKVITDRGRIVTSDLDVKERRRLEERISEAETEDERDRAEAAKEDAWEAREDR